MASAHLAPVIPITTGAERTCEALRLERRALRACGVRVGQHRQGWLLSAPRKDNAPRIVYDPQSGEYWTEDGNRHDAVLYGCVKTFGIMERAELLALAAGV